MGQILELSKAQSCHICRLFVGIDSVLHRRLLLKLQCFGISRMLLTWMKSFLTNRFQRVVLDGQPSEWAEVTSGVPQGSILGPLFFVMYVNDTGLQVKSTNFSLMTVQSIGK